MDLLSVLKYIIQHVRGIHEEISIWEHRSQLFPQEQNRLCRNIVPRNSYIKILIPGTTTATRTLHERRMVADPSFVLDVVDPE